MQVKTNFKQDTTFVLDSHPEASSIADASSCSTVVLMTARSGNQPSSKALTSHTGATKPSAPASGASRRLQWCSADGGSPEQLPAGPKDYPKGHGPEVLGMPLPPGLLDAELSVLSAAGSSRTADEADRKVWCFLTRIDSLSVLIRRHDFPNARLGRSCAIYQARSSCRKLTNLCCHALCRGHLQFGS